MTGPPDFRNALAGELKTSAPREERGHPDLESWIAYVEGRGLDERETERLQTHLEGCGECLATVLELDAFARIDDPPAEEAPDPRRVEAVVQAVRSHAPARRGRPWLRRPFSLAAALLLVALLGILVWALHLHQRVTTLEERIARASQPSAGVLIDDLHPPSVRRQAEEEEIPVTVIPPETAFVTWVLHLPSGPLFQDYRIELLDPEGEVVWMERAPPPDPRFHSLLLGTPRTFLEPGRYTIRVHGLSANEEEPVAQYPVEVRRP